MRRHWNPSGIAAPVAKYSHAVLVRGFDKLLAVSGQLGIAPDGSMPEGCEAQARLIFAALDRCLIEAGMGRRHVLRLNTYLVDVADRAAFMKVRDAWVEDPPPASTLVVVKELVRPEARIEVEILAAA
ncbi:MAG: RidA family protein [Geminicoccaceae bacterium]|nr:RidA family protein [Geminicoccaceae bacterium]MCX8099892.1 RidA family protein [Geminicoccaceae bacterium]MDW8368932.1 RidA family protein [Geminicoccaceae bacterium]